MEIQYKEIDLSNYSLHELTSLVKDGIISCSEFSQEVKERKEAREANQLNNG